MKEADFTAAAASPKAASDRAFRRFLMFLDPVINDPVLPERHAKALVEACEALDLYFRVSARMQQRALRRMRYLTIASLILCAANILHLIWRFLP